MSWFSKSQDHLPLTWWKGQPVYFAAVLALGGVASMVFTALLLAAHTPLVNYLIFTFSGLVDFGRVWTVLSYVLVNPPSLWVIISSYLLWRFGEDVEKFFGRRVFARMFLAFVLVEPLLLSVIGLLGGERVWPAVGLFRVEFAVFIAFATLYPRAQISLILFSVEAWIIAAVFVAVSALESLAAHNWSSLFLLFGQVGLAYSLVRYEQGRWALPGWLPRFHLKRPATTPLRVVRRSEEEEESAADVDAILDKISRKGMESLTAKERRLLEKASEDLGGRGK